MKLSMVTYIESFKFLLDVDFTIGDAALKSSHNLGLKKKREKILF